MNVLNPVILENECLAETGTDRCSDAGGWAGVGCGSRFGAELEVAVGDGVVVVWEWESGAPMRFAVN